MASFLLLHLSPVSLLARRVAPRHVRAFRGTPSLTTGATRGTPSVMSESLRSVRMSLSEAQPTDWARIVEVLRPFVKNNRMERLSRVVGSRRAGLHLVLENVHDAHNAAAVLRTAEGLGVQHVHIIESVNEFKVPAPPARGSGGAQKGVAMGCSRWLSICRYGSSLECVEALRAQGVSVFASDCPPSESDSAEAILAAGGGKVGGEFRHALRTQCPARPLGDLPISTPTPSPSPSPNPSPNPSPSPNTSPHANPSLSPHATSTPAPTPNQVRGGTASARRRCLLLIAHGGA